MKPKRNDRVGREVEVFGKLLIPGRPVVLVRADLPGCLWWVQDSVEPIDAKSFKTRVRFGSETTPDGGRFLVSVVLLRNNQDLERFKPGAAIDEVPWDMRRSATVPVLLDRREKPTRHKDLIVRPAPDSKVSRVEELVVDVDKGARVVVMVRSAEANSFWWVQDRIDRAEGGQVSTTVRFGNDATQSGTRFKIAVLLPRSAKDLDQFQVGAYMRQLPDGVVRSKEVHVIRQ